MPEPPPPPELDPVDRESAVEPGFGLTTAAFVVVSSMVGVGVLTTSGYTVDRVGSNQLMLGLWLAGGIVALCGALTLAELSAALPRSGGEYVILRESYGPLVAFLSGWVSLLFGFAAPIAATASVAADYLLAPWTAASAPPPLLFRRSVASLAIVALAWAHARGRAGTTKAQGMATLATLAALGAFVVVGLAVGWPNAANLADRPATTPRLYLDLTFSMIYISYAYTGWNSAAYLAGEVADPRRILPRAMLLGTGGVVLLYLGVNVVYALALPAAEVREIARVHGSDAVAPIAELAARRLFGPSWAGTTSIGFGLVLLASLSALLLTGPRVAYAMALDGRLPRLAGRLSARSGAPAIATATLATLSLILLWTGTFEGLILFAGLGLAVFSMLSISSIFILRRTRPDLPRPFRTPGYPITPALYLIATGLLTAATIQQRPRVSALSLLGILSGLPFYYMSACVSRLRNLTGRHGSLN